MRTFAIFLAVVITGLALTGPAAHLYALPNKIGMAREPYFIAQSIYSGWWMVGLQFPLAILANLAMAYVLRADPAAMGLALAAAILIVLELTVFFIWTQPANAATSNWTVSPANWEELRRQWEYSHAVNAGIVFAAFCLSTAAALRV